jgi:hypothetical protein
MTVNELVKKLNKLPQDQEIRMQEYNDGSVEDDDLWDYLISDVEREDDYIVLIAEK